MLTRRKFLSATPLIASAAPFTGAPVGRTEPNAAAVAHGEPTPRQGVVDELRLRPGGHPTGYDPWIEIEAAAFRHNVAEASRLADGRGVLAVVKNNAYGLGDSLVGPIMDGCDEVVGIACVRPEEAVAMREAGVTKPIVVMAEVSDEEAAELVARDVTLTVWLDGAGERVERLAQRFGHPVKVQMFIDAGMGREGMPYYRAHPWIADLTGREAVRIEATYVMFPHVMDFDREILGRFLSLVDEARSAGADLGDLHAAPSWELFRLPEAHLDMVRPGNALFGNYPGDDVKGDADLRPVFRMCCRVVRLERLRRGDTLSFGRNYTATRPTWIALLPVGHVDGYPAGASGTCHVMIGGRLYPVVASVSSTHTLVEIGDERTVEVGDVATLIGPDDPTLDPLDVAAKAEVGFYRMITKFNPLLPRRVV